MRCKLIGFGLGLTVWLALVSIPTGATASPLLTYPTGTAMATGSLLKITNIGRFRLKESEWNVECPTANVTGKLVTNSGTTVEVELSTLEMHGLGAGEDCRQERVNGSKEEFGLSVGVTYSGLPWCLRATNLMSTDAFEIKAGRCGEAGKTVTLTLNYTGVKECKYEAAAIKGTFTTDTGAEGGDAILRMSPELKGEASNSFLCAASMPSETAMTMERDSLVAEPVYFS